MMLAAWAICMALFVRWNPDMVYYMLRWVVYMYLLPFTFISMIMARKDSYILEENLLIDNFVLPLGIDVRIVQVAAVIWLIAILVNLVRHIWMTAKRNSFLRGNIPEDDPQAMLMFEEVKNELNMDCEIILERNDMLESPVAVGIWKKYVLLPYEHYEPHELRMIFTHELLHLKKQDLVYKLLAVIVVLIHSFNPCAYLLGSLLNFWSEQDCDARAIERIEKHGITASEYFDLILQFQDKNDHIRRSEFLFSMLFERRRALERRIDFMKKYGKNRKSTPRIITALMVTAFVMFGSGTAYAAGMAIADANDELYKENMEVDSMGGVLNEEDTKPFIVKPVDDPDVVIVEMKDVIATYGTDSFDWTIPVGTRYVTGLKWMSKGTEVTVSVTVSPSDCTFWYGLMDPNDNCSVRETTRGGSATFTTTSTGFHRIMVENRGSKEIRAVGGYSY